MTKVKVDTAQLVWKSSGSLESAWGEGQGNRKIRPFSQYLSALGPTEKAPLELSACWTELVHRGFRNRGEVQFGFKRKLDFKIEQHPSFIFSASLAPVCTSPYQTP